MQTEAKTARETVMKELKEKFKRKVKAIAAVTSIYSTIKSERQSIVKIKSMARDSMLPQGMLQAGSEEL